jgi:predicted transcriptional regulator
MNNLSLKLTKALDTQLTAVAKRKGTSKSAIVRDALQAYLSRKEAVTPTSFAALANDFVGCLDGGPADLSHNKEHLTRFGK